MSETDGPEVGAPEPEPEQESASPEPRAGAGAGSSRWLMVAAVVLGVIGLGLVAGALVRSGGDDVQDGPLALSADSVPPGSTGTERGATTAPLTPDEGLGEGVAPTQRGRQALRGFGEVAVTVTAADGTTCELCLLAATDDAQRERGLMEVTDEDLGGYDGMLFDYPEPVDGSFYMRNTPMPLSIAYFDQGRGFVSATDMVPCGDEPDCRTYPADRPFQYAVEVPAGGLGDLGVGPGATFTVDGRTCPSAEDG